MRPGKTGEDRGRPGPRKTKQQMNYKEMIPVLENLRQSQAIVLARVQGGSEIEVGLQDGCTPVSSAVEGMLQEMYGPGLKVLGLNGFTEQLIWKTEGWDAVLPENASDDEKEAFRENQIAIIKTLTLTRLIDHLKKS